jgi:hypothetical protein
MNQSVMVFDDATARSASITLPIEGMMTYLKDTNTLWIYDGASWKQVAGANNYAPSGLFKITPTSVSGTGASINTRGDVVVSSGGTSFTVNGVFSSSYYAYKLVFTELRYNGASDTYLTLGTSVSGTAHAWSQLMTSISGIAYTGSNGSSSWGLSIISRSAASTSGGETTIFNPFQAEETTFVSNGVDTPEPSAMQRRSAGYHTGNTSFTAFVVSAAVSFANCRLSIYGYN